MVEQNELQQQLQQEKKRYTGALLSPLSTQQGESIPGIGHAVAIEY